MSGKSSEVLRVDIVDLILSRMAAACPHKDDEDHGHCVRCSVLWEVKEQLTAYIAGDSVLNDRLMGTRVRADDGAHGGTGPVICESCKSRNTERYENAGGLKMYVCRDCGWHHEVRGALAAT